MSRRSRCPLANECSTRSVLGVSRWWPRFLSPSPFWMGPLTVAGESNYSLALGGLHPATRQQSVRNRERGLACRSKSHPLSGCREELSKRSLLETRGVRTLPLATP